MARRSRKRKLESEEETDTKWELTNILDEELREEMATMWEIPQIFHFLHMSKEALNISHLSMYEMERMLAMPRASKQLATIMTALLGPPLPRSKMKKVPTMPYDFWVNVLTHKVKGWFKVYRSKHQDIVKVLETIGVEPEFWRILPDDSILEEKEFDQLSFKQRVWILKTLCDTLMHSRKTIQDEMAKQLTEDSYEIVLGADRYGAKFIYFPLFLDNDIRVYRHCIDNSILSTVRPPPWKEGQTPSGRQEKSSRSKRKRSRWKNGSLPRERRRSKKSHEDETKTSDSAIGSSMNEDTNFSGTSSCSNNNNIVGESGERNRSRSPSKTSEMSSSVSGETRSSNAKSSSGYDTTTSDGKSYNEAEEMFRGFDSEVVNDNGLDAIGGINDILNRLASKTGETTSSDNSMPETEIRNVNTEERDNDDKELDDESANALETKFSDSEQRPDSRADSTSDDVTWTKYSPRNTRITDPETVAKELSIFAGMLGDLSYSTFELAADSVDSLRDLATSLITAEPNESRRTTPVPKCEVKLAHAMQDLAKSLEDIEPALKEATRKARTKLRRELINLRDGVIEDQDASGDGERGSNGWILGSQGCPMLSSSETTLQTLSDAALSPAGSENPAERQDSVDEETRASPKRKYSEDGDDNEDEKADERGGQSEKRDSGENDDDEEDSEPVQTRRVLRARGISSYTEQLSSSEEEAYELEEWSRFEAVNPTPGTSDGTSGGGASTKHGQCADQTGEKDPDHDWILPGARKRKSKRSPATRKLKTLQQKISSMTGNSGDSVSSVSPPAPEDPAQPKFRPSPKESTEGALICKVESVHSELDIKDEGPIYECNRGGVNPSGQLNNYSPLEGAYRGTSEARPMRPQGVPPPGVRMMSQHVPPGYYIHGPQPYYDPRYVRYPYPPPGRPGPAYAYQHPSSHPPHPPHPPPPYPGQPQYWQPQAYPPMPPGPYPGSVRGPGVYTVHRGLGPPRHPSTTSTTLYGARVPAQMMQNRMPGPRTVSVQNPALRFPTRPRPPLNQPGPPPPPPAPLPPPPRRQVPRQAPTTRQPAPGPQSSHAPRPNRPNPRAPQTPKKPTEKSTSLILLSDSDDEIEMIVPEKRQPTPVTQSRRNILAKARQADARQTKTRTAVAQPTNAANKTNEVLSPQMLQRMSQGGISITPVKPAGSKQKSGDDVAQGTKLVVVVNETGSHYALALPNGSKLILTPEQVAQIRASNGGKLVL